eukprot:CAMPEP_0177594240 /NCGR_PEP_ID=MMETSP0419_2-20121207/9676_1 /TAXON_ID=582737 /ORGANISM="Tetraselmis sp., Strain GSL018" /LENGTH=123 /DNA_ID=CAMNT_0019085537 /DNA_START=326 /DNA_END=697 /DNA_ORIENTATION=+
MTPQHSLDTTVETEILCSSPFKETDKPAEISVRGKTPDAVKTLRKSGKKAQSPARRAKSSVAGRKLSDVTPAARSLDVPVSERPILTRDDGGARQHLKVEVHGAQHLIAKDLNGYSDPCAPSH